MTKNKSIIDIKKITRLANLSLTGEEEKQLTSQLEKILTYVKRLNLIDTDNVIPTAQVTGLVNVTRPDIIEKSLEVGQTLSGARTKKNNLFATRIVIKK